MSSAVLIALVLTAGISSLNGETFYLAEQVRVGREPKVNDLLLVPSARSPGEDLLPVDTEGRFVYLTQQGLSSIVTGGFPGALIGSGTWLIPEGFTSLENRLLFLLLRRIESVITSKTEKSGYGFYIQEEDIAALSPAFDLQLIRRGTRYFLENGNSDAEPVPVIFLERPEGERQRVPAGTRITIYISRKGLIIEAEGRTNRGAEVGERVPVTLTHTRRRLEALLTGSGEGEVRF